MRGRQLGASEAGAAGTMAPIRGSPFAIECCDPWQPVTVTGLAPAKRAGATLASLGSDLVLYGGDKSAAAVCHAACSSDDPARPWQWSSVGEEARPPARRGHAVAPAGPGRLVVVGGQSLEGEPGDLMDVRILQSSGASFAGASWAWLPAGPQPLPHVRPDGSAAPLERSAHCAAVLGGRTLLVFGGEYHGQLLQELCLLDLDAKVRDRSGWLLSSRRGATA